MARVFVDTSAIYALIDRDDANHSAAKKAFKGLQRLRAEPVITNFIIAEGHALLLNRLGSQTARSWISQNLWLVERVTLDDEALAVEIVCAQTDKTYSYTDATSFAVMKRLRIERAVAFDRHFAQFGFELVSGASRRR